MSASHTTRNTHRKAFSPEIDPSIVRPSERAEQSQSPLERGEERASSDNRCVRDMRNMEKSDDEEEVGSWVGRGHCQSLGLIFLSHDCLFGQPT